jgi:hypothetical protein
MSFNTLSQNANRNQKQFWLTNQHFGYITNATATHAPSRGIAPLNGSR